MQNETNETPYFIHVQEKRMSTHVLKHGYESYCVERRTVIVADSTVAICVSLGQLMCRALKQFHLRLIEHLHLNIARYLFVRCLLRLSVFAQEK